MKSPNKNGTSKKTVLHFTAAWVPPEGETEDPSCSVSGMVQVVDGVPTTQPAYLTYRDHEEDGKPGWWLAISIPTKKQISFGPAYLEVELYKTNLHHTKIERGSVFSITTTDGTVARYSIAKVEVLAG